MSTHPTSAEPTRIMVVESEACHFCEDAQRALTELVDSYQLTVDTSTCAARRGSG